MRKTPRSRAVDLSGVLLPASALVVLALRGGAYDTVTTNLLGLAAWIGVLAGIAFARPPRRSAWIVGGSIFAFMAWVGLSTLWSESAERSFSEFNQASTYLALFTGTVLAAQRIGARARIVDGLTGGLAVVLGLALLSRLEPALFPHQTLADSVADARPRLSYPFNYWNAVALGAAMAVPFFLHLATRENAGRNWRALGVALLPATGLVLYFTFSRGGLMCTLVAAGIFVGFTQRRLQAAIALAIGGLGALGLVLVARSYQALNDGLVDTGTARDQGHKVLILLLAVTAVAFLAGRAAQAIDVRVQLPPRRARLMMVGGAAVALALLLAVVASADLGSRLETLSSDSTATPGSSTETRFLSRSGNGRTEYWKSAVDAWEAHPVAGIGSGTWSLWWQRRPTVANFVRDPHSFWFEAAAELGTIGLLLAVAMLGSVLWAAWQALRARPPDPLAPVLAAAATAFVVSVSIDWTWEITALGAVFFACAALLVARPGSAPAADDDDTGAVAFRRGARQGRMGRGMLVALIAWVAVFAQAVPLIASWQVTRSQDAVKRGDLTGAREAAETARSVMPWAAGPNLQLAQSLEISKDYDAATRYASDAVRKEPTNWQTWLVLARIETRAGNDADARRFLLKARSLNPGSSFWTRIGFTP